MCYGRNRDKHVFYKARSYWIAINSQGPLISMAEIQDVIHLDDLIIWLRWMQVHYCNPNSYHHVSDHRPHRTQKVYLSACFTEWIQVQEADAEFQWAKETESGVCTDKDEHRSSRVRKMPQWSPGRERVRMQNQDEMAKSGQSWNSGFRFMWESG